VWSSLSGLASVVVAVRTGSLSLAGLGVGVLIDVLSSVVLVWRFRQQRDGGKSHLRAERRAQVVAAVGLLLLGVSLVGTGIQHLVVGHTSHPNGLAIGLAAAALVVLPGLAAWKYRAAAAVPSRALRTDAHITLVGATTSAFALVGLVLTKSCGWEWPDPSAAIVIGIIAANEGRKALREVEANPSIS
jgi:divalent metal cation (Fe/Co/Zn/Cd) transporter